MRPLEQLDDEALAQALLDSRALEDAPPGAVQRAIDLWPGPRRNVAAAPAAGPWSRLRAVLAFDSAGQDGLALGLRGAGAPEGEPVRQWLFTAGEHDIDLRASPAGNPRLWQLSGQILGPQSNGTVTLTRVGAEDAGPPQTVTWNEWAEFHFDALEPGEYRLRLSSPHGELELPPVPVGQ